MKVEFCGRYRSPIVEHCGLMLNTISVRRRDGVVVTLDRDMTESSFRDGVADIVFRSAYEYSEDGANYLGKKDISLYDGAVLVDYSIEDDADLAYDLEIEIGQKIAAW